MKEIKFRAWVEGEDGYKIAEVRRVALFGKHYYVYVAEDDYEYQIDAQCLMQFTGITGKDGKERYEGDLLGYTGEKQWPNKVLFEVFYHDGIGRFDCCRTHFQGSACGASYVPPLNSDHLEVVGNIYENPELLGGKR
ncbi:MAG: YopX family protein [Smithella sp.]|jgi:uncharacterized phage protein (TIGR01671 family)